MCESDGLQWSPALTDPLLTKFRLQQILVFVFDLLSFNAYFGYDLEKKSKNTFGFLNLRHNLIFFFSHEWLKVKIFLMLNESTHEFGSLKKNSFLFKMEASSIPWD